MIGDLVVFVAIVAVAIPGGLGAGILLGRRLDRGLARPPDEDPPGEAAAPGGTREAPGGTREAPSASPGTAPVPDLPGSSRVQPAAQEPRPEQTGGPETR